MARLGRNPDVAPALPMFDAPAHSMGPGDNAPVDHTAWLALKAGSPLRGRADQHDASELGLFRAANEPGLL